MLGDLEIYFKLFMRGDQFLHIDLNDFLSFFLCITEVSKMKLGTSSFLRYMINWVRSTAHCRYIFKCCILLRMVMKLQLLVTSINLVKIGTKF